MGTPVLGVSVNFSLKPLKMIHPLWEHSTVPASGKLTHSVSCFVAGLRLNAGSTAGRKLLFLWEFPTFVLH